jgi:hypothetical protein
LYRAYIVLKDLYKWTIRHSGVLPAKPFYFKKRKEKAIVHRFPATHHSLTCTSWERTDTYLIKGIVLM